MSDYYVKYAKYPETGVSFARELNREYIQRNNDTATQIYSFFTQNNT